MKRRKGKHGQAAAAPAARRESRGGEWWVNTTNNLMGTERERRSERGRDREGDRKKERGAPSGRQSPTNRTPPTITIAGSSLMHPQQALFYPRRRKVNRTFWPPVLFREPVPTVRISSPHRLDSKPTLSVIIIILQSVSAGSPTLSYFPVYTLRPLREHTQRGVYWVSAAVIIITTESEVLWFSHWRRLTVLSACLFGCCGAN